MDKFSPTAAESVGDTGVEGCCNTTAAQAKTDANTLKTDLQKHFLFCITKPSDRLIKIILSLIDQPVNTNLQTNLCYFAVILQIFTGIINQAIKPQSVQSNQSNKQLNKQLNKQSNI